MSTPYIGEIRLFPYLRGAPRAWHLCDGTLLAISENETLYAVIGTTYGGDGQTSFALPDLRGRVPIHEGRGNGLSAYVMGQRAGTENVTLTSAQMPSHFHNLLASTNAAVSQSPSGNVLAAGIADDPFYAAPATDTPTVDFPATTIGATGGNQPHDNLAPTLTLQYCIALYGIFPSQS